MLGGTTGNTEKYEIRTSKNKDARSHKASVLTSIHSFIPSWSVAWEAEGRHTNGWMDWWQEKKKFIGLSGWSMEEWQWKEE